jgi:hypothetical protein
MAFLHGHPSATVADVFHRRKFVLADMERRGFGGSTKAAIFVITAGVAQVTRIICYRAAIFTCMCHIVAPLKRGLHARGVSMDTCL